MHFVNIHACKVHIWALSHENPINLDDLVVVYNDGTEKEFDTHPIKEAFKDFRSRCPDFFAYLGPDLKGPSFWRNNCYVLYKGWNYQFQGSYRLPQAIMQQKWGDKLQLIQNEEGMKAFLGNEFKSCEFCYVCFKLKVYGSLTARTNSEQLLYLQNI